MKTILKYSIMVFVLALTSCTKDLSPTDTQAKQFTKVFGSYGIDQGNEVYQTRDGGYIFAGTLTSYSQEKEIAIVKTDQFGNEEWSKTFGNSLDDYGNSIKAVENGYVIAGTVSDTIGSDIYIIRTDLTGDTLWTSTIDNGGNETGKDLIITVDQRILIVGSTTQEDLVNNIPAGTQSIFMVLLDSDGTEVDRLQNGFQQTGNCYANSAIQLPNGNFLLLGSALNSLTGYTQIMVAAYQYANNQITSTPLAYNILGPENKNSFGNAIKQVSSSQVIIGGTTTNSGETNHTAFLNILDGAALAALELTNQLWDENLFDNSILSGINSIYVGANDSIYVAGFTENPSISQGQQDQILVKISKDGVLDEQWGQNLGGTGNDIYNHVQQTADGGFVCIGATEFEGNAMINLTKLNSKGKLINN